MIGDRIPTSGRRGPLFRRGKLGHLGEQGVPPGDSAAECLRYELGEPDDSGRRRPLAIPGSEFEIAVDTVIIAIGNQANPLMRQTTPGLEFNKWSNIVVDDNGKTSLEGVYAGGDIVLGAATVILAMGQGRVAAAGINDYLAGKQ